MLIIGEDSYVSVAEADAYLLKYYLPTDSYHSAWSSLREELKEIYLRRSLFEIDSLAFAGRKVSTEQKLAFPRIFTHYRCVKEPKVPEEIKNAQIENAFALADPEKHSESEFYQRLKMYGVKSYSVGNLSESLNNPHNSLGGYYADKIHSGELTSPIASLMVQPFLVGGVDIR